MAQSYHGLDSHYVLYDYLVATYTTVESLRTHVASPLGIPLPSAEDGHPVERLVVQLLEECKYRGAIDSLTRLVIQSVPYSEKVGGARDRRSSLIRDSQMDRATAPIVVVTTPDIVVPEHEFAGLPIRLIPSLPPTSGFFDHVRLIDQYMSNAWACLMILGQNLTSATSLEPLLHHAIMRGLYVHLLVPIGKLGDSWVSRIFPSARAGFGRAWRQDRIDRYDPKTGVLDQLQMLVTNKLPKRSGRIESYTQDVGVLCDCGGARSATFFILHLSDLHFTSDTKVEHVWRPLFEDLRDQKLLRKIKFLIVSGDVSSKGAQAEFKLASEFLQVVQHTLKVPREHVVLVPGNHDLDWERPVYDWVPRRDECSAFMTSVDDVSFCRGHLRRNERAYPSRFRGFSDFYSAVMGRGFPLAPESQALVHCCSGYKLKFVGLNSAYMIDEHFPRRAALCELAVDAALKAVEKQGGHDHMRIAVWHHPIGLLSNDAVLERLAKARFRLCLHGHLHDVDFHSIRYRYYGGLRALGAGSLSVSATARPESIPQLYNLLEVRPREGTLALRARGRLRGEGAWGPWKGSTESVSFTMRLR